MRDFYLDEAHYFDRMKTEVLPYLNARREDKTYTAGDGVPMHAVWYRADHPRADLVISHGFTESTERYHEMIAYFLRSDLNVLIGDHRGHGTSYRYLPDQTLTHVERFGEYIDDLDVCIRTCLPDDGLPRYLYAHSMGGGIAALYLETHPGVFSRAVLTAPMIAPHRHGVPWAAARGICRVMKATGRNRARSFTSKPYAGHEDFATSCCTSEVRFEYYQELRLTHPELQNNGPTYGWIMESLGVERAALAKGKPEGVTIPVLVFAAEHDHMVARPPMERFAARLPHGKLVEIPGSKHEIYASRDAALYPYLEQVLDFFS